ncbi:hypothetical protein D3C85_1480580 [compost metagenome]
MKNVQQAPSEGNDKRSFFLYDWPLSYQPSRHQIQSAAKVIFLIVSFRHSVHHDRRKPSSKIRRHIISVDLDIVHHIRIKYRDQSI